jgi:hypothetical protein
MSEPARKPEPCDDPRFPSGPWVGFFLQPAAPGKHTMELILDFAQGEIRGEGRDRIGEFFIRGRFQVEDGRCWWTKSYVGLHDVSYQGYNEGKGIWGQWEIGTAWRGGFHIWPEAMGDPTTPKMSTAEDVPAFVDDFADVDAEAETITIGQ